MGCGRLLLVKYDRSEEMHRRVLPSIETIGELTFNIRSPLSIDAKTFGLELPLHCKVSYIRKVWKKRGGDPELPVR